MHVVHADIHVSTKVEAIRIETTSQFGCQLQTEHVNQGEVVILA
jgi:hypothetical protein